MKLKLFSMFILSGFMFQSLPARAEIDSFQVAIKTSEINGRLYFEHCESHDGSAFCKPITPYGIDPNGVEDFEKFCKDLRIVGPIENIAVSILIGGGGTVIGVAMGTAGGPPGIAAGAVLGTTAGGGVANLIAPPVDSRSIGTALRYLDGIRGKQAYAFSLDKVAQVEKGLKGCLKRYEAAERWVEIQMQDYHNSQYGHFQP